MNTEVSITDLISLIGVTVLFIKLFLPSVWPSKVDKSTIDHRRADIATKYEKLVDDGLERIEKLQLEIESNRAEFKARSEKGDARFAKLKTEVGELRIQLRERDQLLDELQDGIDRLIKQLEAHKITPAWTPPERKPKTATNT